MHIAGKSVDFVFGGVIEMGEPARGALTRRARRRDNNTEVVARQWRLGTNPRAGRLPATNTAAVRVVRSCPT